MERKGAGKDAALFETDTEDWSGCGVACGEGDVDFRDVAGAINDAVEDDPLDVDGSMLLEGETSAFELFGDGGTTDGMSNSAGRTCGKCHSHLTLCNHTDTHTLGVAWTLVMSLARLQ